MDLKAKLKQCNTLNEVIRTVDQEYDLDKPLGPMAKMVVTNGIEKLLITINAKKR